MGQEFHVLRCFTCQSFQVQQVKKVNRWSCKLCGEKQSLLKEFGRGSGADCRRHVQKLNARRGAMVEEREQSTLSLWEQMEENPKELSSAQVSPAPVSRWSKYLVTPEKEPQENVLIDRQHLHGNNRKRKRTSSRSTLEQVTSLMTSSLQADQVSPDDSRARPVIDDGQVKEGEGSIVSNKPRPRLPVSSMFESGDDFTLEF